jgi:predicted ArsR family transcriptional regulator
VAPRHSHYDIVQHLKQHSGATAQEIAAAMGVTAVAIRKHLEVLAEEGKVAVRRLPLPRGRPKFVYELTGEAASLFPKAYDRLAVDLLDEVVSMDGEEKLGRLFRVRNEKLVSQYMDRLGNKGFVERLEELARLRDEEGYMAVLRHREGSYVLTEHHCPIYAVAQRFPAACECEAELFKQVLDRDVERETRLVDGQASCTYRIAGSLSPAAA